MNDASYGRRGCLPLLTSLLLLGCAAGLQAYTPNTDLTVAGAIATLKGDANASPTYNYSYNLGPTGLRGWIFIDRNNVGDYGTMTAQPPWQILVSVVGANTPASGVMAVDDVILGASAGTGAVPLFTSDARKSLGWAIGAAEVADGVLSLKRWRAGVTSDVTLQLQIMGAYSATAPYDCPKSALVLSNACNVLSNLYIYGNQSFGGTPGGPVLALALLATGNPAYLPKLQAYAQSIAPAAGSLSPNSCDTWGWGYRNVFLSEYYLATADATVLTGIKEYTINLAKSQSLYGTFGHGGAERHADGSLHGSIAWYGPVNSAGLVANMGIVMGRKCFVASGSTLDPEIDLAIDRGSRFFGYYVGKGSIPYGEHEPWAGGHGSNGKDCMATLFFGLQGNQPTGTEYFTRMAVAGYNGREYGHTGQGFSYLWGALAANVGGTNAVASHLAQVRWHLDLSRRWDGSFVYDGGEQYGCSAVSDYWANGGNNSYAGIDPTASYVLTYSLPRKQLYLTGRNADPANYLSSDVVTNAIWVGMFNQVCGTYNTNQLVSAMGEYDPGVRSWAADTIGTNVNTSFSMLTNMASSTNVLLREAACQALGAMGNTGALALLGQRLTDTNIWVRSKASRALQNFGAAAQPQLNTMLTAFVTNATDPHVIVWEDPVQIANGYLANELFSTLGAYTISAPTNLLYPALRAGLQQPDGMALGSLSGFLQNRLSWADVQAVAPSIIAAVAKRSPADRMFSDGIRYAGVATLAKYHVEEGLPLVLMVTEQAWDIDDFSIYWVFRDYWKGSARSVLPTLYTWQNYFATYSDRGNPTWTANKLANIGAAIAAITNDPSPVVLNTFKQITAATASPLVVNLPSTNSLLSVSMAEVDGGTPRVAWSKVRGAGNVSFSPNGTASSSNCLASFDTAGSYVLQAAVVDGSILDSNIWITYNLGYPGRDFQTYTNYYGAVYSNVTVTVSDGTVHTNLPPVALPQSSSLPADSVQGITLLGLDPEGFALIYTVASSPAHGTLLGTPPNITYTPTANYQGPDSFTFTVTDSEGAVSPLAIVALTVVDPPPVANAQYVETAPNTAVAFTLSGTDTCSLPLTYAILSPPAHGGLTGSAPNLTYTPTNSYTGADSFTFKVNNGLADSPSATVTIGIAQGQGWTNIAAGSWSVGANWAGSAAPAAGGATNYQLSFNTSPYSGVSSNDLGVFQLNRLSFGSALPALTLSGNALAFAVNSSILPQVKVNSANAVTVSNAFTLGAPTTIGGGAGGLNLYGLISGPGALTNTSSGILLVGGASINTFSGGVTVNAGTLVLNQSRFNLGTGALTLADGTTFYTANFEGNGSGGAITNTVNLSGGYVTFPLSFGGTKDDWISGPVTGSGGILVSGTTRTLTLTASNSFGGGVIFQGADCGLQLGHANALGTGVLVAQKVTAGSGALQASADLSGGSGVPNPIDIAPNSYLNVNLGNHLKLSGPITDSGSLYKAGTATLTLAGTNTYSGSTTVSAGVLKLSSPASLGLYTDLYLPANSGSLNLAFTGTNCIHGLYINGVQSPAGVYSSSTPQITGTGYLRVGAVPVAPAGLSALGKDAQVTLLWSPAASATGYNVKRSLSGGGPYTLIATTAGTSYTNSPVSNGTTYYYVVSAFNSIGEGADSASVSAQPNAAPVAPAGLNASATNAWVNLAWAPVSGALGYNVKRSLTSGGAYAVVGVTAATNYADAAVDIGTPYYYVLSALNAVGESANSPQASATPIQVPGVLLTNIAPGNWSAGASWLGGSAPVAGGANTYNLKWNTTPYAGVSFNDFAGAFVLNRMEFGSALPALTNGGNSIQFAANGTIQPQILQNSTKAVVVSNSLALGTSTTVAGSGAGTVTLAGVISGAGSLIQSNSSTVLVLPRINSFSGGVTLSAGTLTPYGDGSGASKNWLGTGPLTLAGGTSFKPGDLSGQPLRLPNAITLSGGMAGVVIPFGGGTDLKLDGPISGPGGLAISGGTRGLNLQGNNMFSGGVTLSDGNSVQIASLTALGTGTLRLGNSGSGILRAVASLATGLGVANPIDLTSGWTLTVDSSGYNLQLSGPIANTGSITKISAGTLILSGTNTYSGKTTVSAGVLQATSPVSLSTATDVYLTTSSGSLDLEYTGAAVVHALYINGTKQANGLYGSSTVPITGPGYLLVGPPAAPTGLSATAGNALVNLNWSASLGASSYTVKRSLVTNGTFTALGYTSGTNYTDSGLINGAWYYYLVTATNSAGASANSLQVAAKPLAPPTPVLPPGGVTMVGGVPTFTFTAAAGFKYRLDFKNLLTDPGWLLGTWTTNTTGSAQSMTLADPSAVSQPQRFYRLEAAYP